MLKRPSIRFQILPHLSQFFSHSSSVTPAMWFNGFKLFDRLAIMMLTLMNGQQIGDQPPSQAQTGLTRTPPLKSQPPSPPPSLAMQNQMQALKLNKNHLTSNQTIRKPAAISSSEGQSHNPNGHKKGIRKPAVTTTIRPAINHTNASAQLSNPSDAIAKKHEPGDKAGRIKVKPLAAVTASSVDSTNE